jgi:hypothetical protein
MTATSYVHGHLIQRAGKCWTYRDNGEPIDKRRPCARCGEATTKEGHDACLGTLPGIQSACCGHGELEAAYIQFADGSSIRGLAAVKQMAHRHTDNIQTKEFV